MSEKALLEQLLALLMSLINGDTTIEAARSKAIEIGHKINSPAVAELLEELEADPE